ncbi:MAG: acylphosphatase [Polyangiaceae bacterium]
MRVELTIRGRVQGVYFRASMEAEGNRLGLRGWVKNREDGGVEACIEGPEAVVHELIAWAHHGPPAASVSHVEVRRMDQERPEPAGFRTAR